MCMREMSISNHCQPSLVTKNWIIYLSSECKWSSSSIPREGLMAIYVIKIIRYEGFTGVTSWRPAGRRAAAPARAARPAHRHGGRCSRSTLFLVLFPLTSSDRTKSEERASAWDDLSPPASRIFSSVTNKDNAGEQMSCKHWIIVNVLTASANIIRL